MVLQALLAEVDPGWFGDVDPALVAEARGSVLGRRMLSRWLAAESAGALFAPTPAGKGFATQALRWPRARLRPLLRDLGILAYAPAIRAEIRRDPVRRLRAGLGNSYLLALDQTVWDGKVERALGKRLETEFQAALAAKDAGDAALWTLFDRQGRHELRHWAAQRDRALGEWVALLHPREDAGAAHLPEKPVLRVTSHHETRARAA